MDKPKNNIPELEGIPQEILDEALTENQISNFVKMTEQEMINEITDLTRDKHQLIAAVKYLKQRLSRLSKVQT